MSHLLMEEIRPKIFGSRDLNAPHSATHTATHCNTHCNTLQHTLQHTATHWISRSIGFPDRSFEWRGFWLRGTPFTHMKTCMTIWVLPWKRVWYVRGLPWKLVGNFGIRNYLKSDLLRPWCLSSHESLINSGKMKNEKTMRYMRYVSGPCMTTGWRRLIGSPKLQIIFHKRATKYRSLLRKMTYKDKGSYESSPPCSHSL